MHRRIKVVVNMWRSEDSFLKSVLSFCLPLLLPLHGSGCGTLIIRPAWQVLSPLSHLASSGIIIFILKRVIVCACSLFSFQRILTLNISLFFSGDYYVFFRLWETQFKIYLSTYLAFLLLVISRIWLWCFWCSCFTSLGLVGICWLPSVGAFLVLKISVETSHPYFFEYFSRFFFFFWGTTI